MLSSHQSHSFSLFLFISLSIYLSFSSFSSISSHIHIVLFIYSSFFDQTIFRNQPSIEMDKVFHSFIIIIIIVRFLFRRNIYIYIYRFFPPFLLQLFQPTTSRDVSLDLHPPRPPPSGISLVETGFIPVYRSSSSSPVSQRFGENSARNGRAATRLSSTKLIHQHHHRHHHCSFTTRYTSPPHDISPRVIKRPGKVRGGEDGGGGLQPRLIKFWTRIAALRPNFEKRHGVNWKLVSLPIHGGVPWYRKKLPSTLLLPPLFFFSFRARG